ncbi:MAG TPA: hypothetical protein PK335_01055 [Draconibacterium sp.]|nr:hypothetical protein [Draconibacterium sp.]
MKALKFRLFATMITLAAVLIISINPVSAQRRSTEKTNRETTSRNVQRKAVQNKSASKNYDRVDKNRSRNEVKSSRSSSVPAQVDRSRTNRNNNSVSSTSNRKNTSTPRNLPSNRDVEKKSNSGNSRTVINQGNTQRSQNRENSYRVPQNQSRDVSVRNRETPVRVNTSTVDGRRNTGRTVSNNRDFYRTDKVDRRYTPSRDFKGRNDYWTERNRPVNMNYNRNDRDYYSHYNYNNHKHWDRSWERYRWNYNSWRDYYHGYNPRSFVYYRYYYHHPHYGHVIRRFDFRPLVFVHNFHKYYFYDGHFFRYRSGIGYILVDLPFGFTFEMIPASYYERVYINGYLYFRVGNLFFESTPYGLSLTHYPDRYYAWDNSYEREGYMFDDDYY